MAGINRTNSPMNLYRNDFSNTKEQLDKAREIIINEQNHKPAFLVGSIDRVNERIAEFDRKLQVLASSLVIESRASDGDDSLCVPPQDGPSVKARDVQELNQFAGVFSAKSMLAKDPSSRHHLRAVNAFKKKKETKATKPKLVELFQFSGFEDDRLTPLPEVDSTLMILKRVTEAQLGLDRKPHYRDEFRRLFNSKMSEAVLVDSFWWYFLDHYHPDKQVQLKLFNRVAHNYVKLLMSADHPKYRDVFFLRYADLLAQAMYAAFCAAFPDSWRQFDDDFISGICELTSLWVTGTKPCPESWKGWNFGKLGPKNFKKEAIMKQDTKKGNALNLDFSLSDIDNSHQSDGFAFSSDKLGKEAVDKGWSPSDTSFTAPSHRSIEDRSIDWVAQAQASRGSVSDHRLLKQGAGKGSSSWKTVQSRRKGSIPTKRSSSLTGQGSKMLHAKESSGSSLGREGAEQAGLHSPRSKNSQLSVIMETRNRRSKVKSHPVAAGPTFNKYVFNISGQSPLVKHFLQKKGLQKKAGTEVLLQRTEIDKLPLLPSEEGAAAGTEFLLQRTEIDKLLPSDSETYQDVIQDALQSVKLLDDGYQQLHDDGIREHTEFIKDQKRLHREHMRRENALMSRPREVKRLSDLLVLELLKDPDEVNTGAAQAVEEALLHRDRSDPP